MLLPPICFVQNINNYSHILQYIFIVVLFNKLLLSRFVITLGLFLSIQLRRKTSNDLIPSFSLKTRGDNRCDSLLLFSLFFFFYLGFLSSTFTIHRTAGEEGGYLFNSSLPLPPTSQTLRHCLGNYCRELTSVHSQQPDSDSDSKRKLLTIKLLALLFSLERYQT